jgi:uncharacterized repeat protein (TIGR01451 family)
MGKVSLTTVLGTFVQTEECMEKIKQSRTLILGLFITLVLGLFTWTIQVNAGGEPFPIEKVLSCSLVKVRGQNTTQGNLQMPSFIKAYADAGSVYANGEPAEGEHLLSQVPNDRILTSPGNWNGAEEDPRKHYTYFKGSFEGELVFKSEQGEVYYTEYLSGELECGTKPTPVLTGPYASDPLVCTDGTKEIFRFGVGILLEDDNLSDTHSYNATSGSGVAVIRQWVGHLRDAACNQGDGPEVPNPDWRCNQGQVGEAFNVVNNNASVLTAADIGEDTFTVYTVTLTNLAANNSIVFEHLRGPGEVNSVDYEVVVCENPDESTATPTGTATSTATPTPSVTPTPSPSSTATSTPTQTPTLTPTPTGTATNVPGTPGITIKKYTNGHDADVVTGPEVNVGSSVYWTYVVSNTGTVPLNTVIVTDSVSSVLPIYVSGDTDHDTVLDLGEVWYYQATGTAIQGQYGNVGYVRGRSPEGAEVSDSDPSHYFGKLSDVAFIKVCKAVVIPFLGKEFGFPGMNWNMTVGDVVQVTDASGCTTFEVTPGSHLVKEEVRPGWMAELGTETTATVVAGQVLEVWFKNRELNPFRLWFLWFPKVETQNPITVPPDPTPTPPVQLCPVVYHESGTRGVNGPISPGLPETPLRLWVKNEGGWTHGVWLVNQIRGGEEPEEIYYESVRCNEDTCSSNLIFSTDPDEPRPYMRSQLIITVQLYGGRVEDSDCGKVEYTDPEDEETPPEAAVAGMITFEEALRMIEEAFKNAPK